MKKITVIALAFLCVFAIIGCDFNSLISSLSDQVATMDTDDFTTGTTETTNVTDEVTVTYSDPIQQELVNKVAAVETAVTGKTIFAFTTYTSIILNDAQGQPTLDTTYDSEFLIDVENHYMWERFNALGAEAFFLVSMTDGILYLHTLVDDVVVASEILAETEIEAMFAETLEGQEAGMELLPLPETGTFLKISEDEYRIEFALSEVFDDPDFAELIAPTGVYDKVTAESVSVVMTVKFGADSSVEMTLDILNVGMYPFDGSEIDISYRMSISFPATYEPIVVTPYLPEE